MKVILISVLCIVNVISSRTRNYCNNTGKEEFNKVDIEETKFSHVLLLKIAEHLHIWGSLVTLSNVLRGLSHNADEKQGAHRLALEGFLACYTICWCKTLKRV